MRRRLPSLVTFALVAIAAVALAQVGGTPRARAAAIAATGSFEIADSQGGEPIFAAAGLAPGEATTGTVSIEDLGPEPVALTLRRGALVDVPGLGGGLLSGRLELSVVDVTRPAAPVPVYAGPLDSMPAEAAGRLEPGAARTFEFVATLPGGGTASFQNAVQGASTTVGYSWIATAPTAAGGGGEIPTAPRVGGPTGGGGAARGQLSLRVRRIRRNLRHGRLVAWVDCNRSCRLSVRGRLRAGAWSVRHGVRIHLRSRRDLAAGPRQVRIRVPRGPRRRLLESSDPGPLRAKLRFLAVGTNGERDAVRKSVRLRVRRH